MTCDFCHSNEAISERVISIRGVGMVYSICYNCYATLRDSIKAEIEYIRREKIDKQEEVKP
jgi:hypothetical protein